MESNTKKTLAALSSVIWSALLTLFKFIVGLTTGSLGILSEALHSGLDLLAAGGTLFAVRLAAKPADEDHPYGYGKAENLTALAETLLLLATALWVLREAVLRLTSDNPDALHIETSIWAFVVVIASLSIDINRAAMLRRVARETNSAALEADAAHFATDIWSSAAVLLGISGAALADYAVEGSGLQWVLMRADVFASMVVALLILSVCRQLGMKAINTLMDKADSESGRRIRAVMAKRMPAYPLARLRMHEVGNKPYVDMVVLVPKALHVDTADEIADAIEALVAETLPEAETMVHTQPAERTSETPDFTIRRIALTHRFGVHGLLMIHAEQGLIISVDLEMPPDAPLENWQVPVEAFRHEVARSLNAARVVVHVEPNRRVLPPSALPMPEPGAWREEVRAAMIRIGAPLPTSIEIYCEGDARSCIVTIPMESTLTVAESHERLTLLTQKLTEELPAVARMLITYSD